MLGAHLSGHVGAGSRLKEKGGDGVGWLFRMDEGQSLVDCAKRIKMAVTNTFFQTRQKLWLTYKS